ncbi:MAG: hypothetical protein NVSMB65_17350 [Chloroflexota bacterium]
MARKSVAPRRPAPPRPRAGLPLGRRGGIAAGALLLVAVLVVVGMMVAGRRQGTPASAHPAPAATPHYGGVMMPDEGRGHVVPGVIIPYKHYPPTSGTHYYVPAPLGVYPAPTFPHPLPEGYWVHNLEHGAIVILYRCPRGCPALAKQLAGLLHTFPNGKHGQVQLIVTPYARLQHRIAILAWRWLDQMDTFDQARLTAFYRMHVGQGPEDPGVESYIR